MKNTRIVVSLLLFVSLVAGCLDQQDSVQIDESTDSTIVTPASVEVAHEFATHWIDKDPVMLWNWGEFVLLYGMWRIYEITDDQYLFDYFVNYYRDKHDDYEPVGSDLFSPATIGLLLCEKTGEAEFCDNLSTYDKYFDDAQRVEGILVHWAKDGELGSIWLDTIVMACSYEIERGTFLEGAQRDRWFDDLVVQFVGMDQYLNDAETNLLNHAYDFATPEDPILNGEGAFWARGNAWYIASLGNFLQRLPADDARRDELTALWVKRIKSVLPYQGDDGHWHTIIPRTDDDYIESSATMLIAAGIAGGINAGVKDPIVEEARIAAGLALDSVTASLYRDSRDRYVMPNISIGTNPGSYQDYLDVSVRENIHYGVGAYFWAAAEVAQMRGELE